MKSRQSITCAILAGGASRRFGKNKLALNYRGKSFLQHTIETLSTVSKDIIVSGENCESLNVAPCRCFSDSFPLKASIVGIHTALKSAESPVVLVVAGDLPLLKQEVLHLLIEKFFTNDCDAVVPIVKGYMEPLVAVYARSNLAIIEENIHSQRLKIVDFIRRVHTETLSEREIRTVDPELCSFMNINTRADYYELVRRGHGPSPNPEGESQLF